MRFVVVEAELHENGLYAQFACNLTCNSRGGIFFNSSYYQKVTKRWIARLFSHKTQANSTQFKAEELDTVIRQNLEVLDYGE